MPLLTQPVDLVGVVGVQHDRLDLEGVDHGRGVVVAAHVAVEAEVEVGLEGVEAVVLQLVGPDLLGDADAAAFLAHVEDQAEVIGGDAVEGELELVAAVAAQRAEHVAGEALGVHAGRDFAGARDRAADNGDVVEPLALDVGEGDDLEVSPWREGSLAERRPVRAGFCSRAPQKSRLESTMPW